ncbi:MAG: NAD(P)-dependent oxidoreductase [Elusimicrobia bacterium]|nr:NAD(P)-dependent oxidoreductase [Elusimicrobiota bacterium]
MSILITGGDGFVGHNLVDLFLAKKYPLLYPGPKELDLTDSGAVEKYLKANPAEVIVHCATVLRDRTDYPADTCEKNLRMFFNLLKYRAPAAKLICLGSGSEYARGHWKKKMPEEYFDEHIPGDGHSYAKYLISKYIQEIPDENTVCLRVFGIYGKYEDYRYKFISNAIVKNILKLPIVINQNVVYDYLSAADFAGIVEYFMAHKAKHRVLNATPTESIDLVTIAKLVNEASDYQSEIRVLNPGVGVEYSGDNRKLLSELGDFRFTPHKETIAALRGYYLAMKDGLDARAIEQDDYLKYAEKLKNNYFDRQNAK